MGYKVGDEVLVKAKINDICVGEIHPYEVKAVDNPRCGDTARVIYIREEDVLPVPDMTAKEAWALAGRIICEEKDGGMPIRKLAQIFGTNELSLIMSKYTEKEVKRKIKEWEEQNEINVGDVVCVSLGNEGESAPALVTLVHENNFYDMIMNNGLGWTYVNGDRIRKTGRHIDINGLLKQIRLE